MKFWQRHKIDILFAVIVFAVALIPRVADLGVFLTADEKSWMLRSYEFIRAFKDVRLNEMLQTTHPGVIPLWLMGGSITAWMFISHVPFSFQNLAHFIVAAQLPIAVANAVAVPLIYLFLRRVQWPLLKESSLPITHYPLPLLASLFIALNPVLIGYSRVAHVDAMLASFMFLAALATILYVQKDYSRKWLLISAVLSGLAILTKAPGIFLIPFFWLVVLLSRLPLGVYSLEPVSRRSGGGSHLPLARPALLRQSAEKRPSQAELRELPRNTHPKGFGSIFSKIGFVSVIRDFIIWLLIIGVMIVVIWPVFITVENPKGNANILRRDLSTAAATPHHMSEDYTVEGSFYPATLLTRTTPVMLVLSILYFAFGIWSVVRKRGWPGGWAGLALVGYVFFFVLMMTLGAKKGDRYVLPVFLALDVLAAAGAVLVAQWVVEKSMGYKVLGSKRYILPTLYVLPLLFLGGTVAWYHPYTVAYSNPLFPDNLSQELGWGEGLDQVAAWFNEHDPNTHVASWYDQELAQFTSASVVTIGGHEQPHIKYVVLYHNMFGRAPDHPANDYIDEYYKKREPVFTAEVVGKPYAWVYEKEIFRGTTGELLPGSTVSRRLTAQVSPVAGLEILFATYNDRAQSGTVFVDFSVNGERIHRWEIPVEQLEDDRWQRFLLPQVQEAQDITVAITATGTSEDDAPTVRDGADGAAVRLLYAVENEIAHKEHTLLLK